MSFYLGIPDEEWHLYLSEAEELLIEENIGTHILGMYPYGERIYGDESEPPGVLCIYFDDPADLLDPCLEMRGQRKLSVGTGCNPIRFISLYTWAQLVAHPVRWVNGFHNKLCHIIPPMGDVLYEDNQLTAIMDIARRYLQKTGWGNPLPDVERINLSSIQQCGYAASLRARLVLQKTGVFAPCLNKGWTESVVALDESWSDNYKDLYRADQALIAKINGEAPAIPTSELAIMVYELVKALGPCINASPIDAMIGERAELGYAVRNLYRSLL